MFPPLAAPFPIYLFLRQQFPQKSVGVIPILKLNLCLAISLHPALWWWGGVRELLMLGTELLGHKEKERKTRSILPLRFLTVLFVLHIPTELRAISPICAQHRHSHQTLAESWDVHKAETPKHWHSPHWNHLWIHSFCATWGLTTLNTFNKLSVWSLRTAVSMNQTCSTVSKCRKAK